MASNQIQINEGTGGKYIKTDTITGIDYGITKLYDATVGSTSPTGVAANPFQVSIANTGTNATAIKVDNSAVTQPISVASLPLPTGAATETTLSAINTKTPALGQALAAASVPVVLTAAQITTLTPPTTVTANIGTSGSLALETGGNLATIAGAITSTKMQSNVAQINGITPLMGNGVTGTGSQRVTIASDNTAFTVNAGINAGSNIIGKVTTDQTTHGTTDLVAADITKVAGTALDVNSGVKSAGTIRVVIATDQPSLTNALTVTANAGTNLNTSALALETGGNLATIGGSYVSQGTALGSIKNLMVAGSVTTAAPTYTTGNINPLSLTTAGGLRVDLKDTASNTNNLNVNLAASSATVTVSGNVTSTPSASSTALSLFRNTALSNTAVAVKASAGRVHYVHFYNSNTADTFVQFYNVAQGSVIVGTTTPDFTWWVPGGGVIDTVIEPNPLPATTAITIAATTTAVGGTAPSTGLLVNILYI